MKKTLIGVVVLSAAFAARPSRAASIEDYIPREEARRVAALMTRQLLSTEVDAYRPKGFAKELPEINDEFAQDVSEFDTLDEYKEDLKKAILERKEKAAESELKNKLLDAVVATAEMDMPKPMVDEECETMINDYAQTLRYQGMDMNQYMKYTGTTMESLMASVRPEAEKRLKENLVLEAIAKAEGLEVSEEEIDGEFEKMASMYGMEVDQIKNSIGKSETDGIRASLLNTKALDFLVANAVD